MNRQCSSWGEWFCCAYVMPETKFLAVYSVWFLGCQTELIEEHFPSTGTPSCGSAWSSVGEGPYRIFTRVKTRMHAHRHARAQTRHTKEQALCVCVCVSVFQGLFTPRRVVFRRGCQHTRVKVWGFSCRLALAFALSVPKMSTFGFWLTFFSGCSCSNELYCMYVAEASLINTEPI